MGRSDVKGLKNTIHTHTKEQVSASVQTSHKSKFADFVARVEPDFHNHTSEAIKVIRVAIQHCVLNARSEKRLGDVVAFFRQHLKVGATLGSAVDILLETIFDAMHRKGDADHRLPVLDVSDHSARDSRDFVFGDALDLDS